MQIPVVAMPSNHRFKLRRSQHPARRKRSAREGRIQVIHCGTTPHLFIIDPNGVLVYEGGIDSIRSARVEDIAKATNYVTAALADLKEGRPVQHPTSRPYGCSVKY